MKNSASAKLAAPPRGYSPEARGLWRDVVGGWVLDPAALKILDVACRALIQDREAEKLVARDGLTILDRFGQPKLHPAATVSRDAKATFLKALRQLGLDLEPLHGRPGRPPGR
jgi:P27 family predicted phage terminase small subunit